MPLNYGPQDVQQALRAQPEVLAQAAQGKLQLGQQSMQRFQMTKQAQLEREQMAQQERIAAANRRLSMATTGLGLIESFAMNGLKEGSIFGEMYRSGQDAEFLRILKEALKPTRMDENEFVGPVVP
jgi:hypothetical protein